jgi:PAT family beta-lactamase induction signal transducer AmpG
VVDAIGWKAFFWSTIPFGIPGMLLLARFVPLGVAEPSFTVEPPKWREPLTARMLVLRGLLGGALAALFATAVLASLAALKAMSLDEGRGFDLGGALAALVHPAGVADWVQLVGIVAFGLIFGLFTAAVFAARRGAGEELVTDETR